MKRSADTNQRMFFDVNSAGEYLATGNTDGSICTWFVGGSQSASKDEIHDGSGEKTDSANTAADASDFPPLLTFRAHEDCVNGVRYTKPPGTRDSRNRIPVATHPLSLTSPYLYIVSFTCFLQLPSVSATACLLFWGEEIAFHLFG